MTRVPFYLCIACSVLLLAGAFGLRVPSVQERLHPRAALVLLSGHTQKTAAQVENAAGVAGIALPIEVVSGTGTATKSVTVNVNSPGSVGLLWLQVHQPGYKYGDGSRDTEGMTVQNKSDVGSSPKMWVRINNGQWIKVDNTVATCADRESTLDCVGGMWETVRFTIPVREVTSSTTVEFYFNGTDGFTSGFRVLDMDFLASSYGGDRTRAAIDQANAGKITDTFVHEDFSTWRPPAGYTDQSAINAGKSLYNTAKLKDFPGGPAIGATCVDCHNQNAYDLKFFNFSNESIIARSTFHGLTEAEAKQIAAYVRSQTSPAVGTPWDPPYQPGPTRKLPTMEDCIQGRPLDDLPQHCWAAGAGLEWVLEKDEHMEPYIFPNGINSDAVDTDLTMNVRQMPISNQYPDWNEWVPRVFPGDVWGNAFYNSEMNKAYEAARNAIASPGASDKEVFRYFDAFTAGGNTFRRDHITSRGLTNLAVKNRADAFLSYAQWSVMKQFELMKVGDHEDVASRHYEHGEVRGWLGNNRNVFDVAPHIIWNEGRENRKWIHGGDGKAWTYFTTVWYDLQIVLNPSYRTSGTNKPVDWKYQLKFVNFDGNQEAYRYYRTYVKMLQELDNPDGVDDGDSKGWYWRHITPAWLLGGAPGSYRPMQNLGADKESRLISAVMKSWIEKTSSHPISEWKQRTKDCSMTGIEDVSFTPTAYTGGRWLSDFCYSNHLYRVIPAFDELGVDNSTLVAMAEWGEKAWPKGDWSSLVKGGSSERGADGDDNDDSDDSGDGNGGVEGGAFDSPVVDAQYRAGEVVTFAGSPAEDRKFKRMEAWVDGVRRCDDAKAPFSCKWTATAGNFKAFLKFVPRKGKALNSEVREITVLPSSGSGGSAVAQSVILQPGWNTVSFSTAFSDSSISAVVAPVADDIGLVKDASGQIYSPEHDVAQIRHWSPRKAYMVYARREVSWPVQGTPLAPEEVRISLQRGWNWVPYLPDEALDIEKALTSIAETLVLVTNADGKAYYPASDINEIGAMYPGQGYRVYVERACTLVYPKEGSSDAAKQSNALATGESSDDGAEH